MKKPIIAINFKAYPRAFGKEAEKLVRMIDKYAFEYSVDCIVAVPLTEIRLSSVVRSIKVYAQTSHAVDFGSYTGHVPTKALIHYGIRGVVVNHSENELTISAIERIVNDAKDLNLEVLLCSPSIKASISFASYDINYLAYEPPELIGTGKSVSTYRGEDIKHISKVVKNSNFLAEFLVGAGISSRKDIDVSLQLGADGVFLSSYVMKSKNIEKTLEDIFAYW